MGWWRARSLWRPRQDYASCAKEATQQMQARLTLRSPLKRTSLRLAVAMAAALNVTQPWSTGKGRSLCRTLHQRWISGIGGDACALYYNSSSRKVESLSGFGRSGAAFTRERVIADGFQNCAIPAEHGSVDKPNAQSSYKWTVVWPSWFLALFSFLTTF